MTKPYRIVIGIDFETTGDEALRMGVELAQVIPSAELHLTTVVVERSGSPSAAQLAEDERLIADTSAGLAAHVGAWTARFARGARQERPMTIHVRLGDAAEALNQVAVDVDADLIVVGTHSSGGIARFVLGSVSERVVKLARVPVLVARPKDYAGLPRTATQPEAARPGQTEAGLHAKPRHELRGTLQVGARTPHLSGGI